MTGLRSRLSGASIPATPLGGATTRNPWDSFGKAPEAPGPCQDHDPEVFFPESVVAAAAALEVCGGCQFRRQCAQLATGVPGRVSGVWAGVYIPILTGKHRAVALAKIRQIAGDDHEEGMDDD